MFSRRSLLASAFLILVPAASWAGEKVAIKGYDPVAYFTEGRPVKGSSAHQARFDEATYHFKNAENHALFVADPAKYAPQYEGFCTIMVSKGTKYEPDPEAWIIADDRLYLFGAKGAVESFKQNKGEILAQAERNWSTARTR